MCILVGADDGRMVVVGDNGTGLKPSMRVVGAAWVTIGLSRMDGGVAGADVPAAEAEAVVEWCGL